MTKLLDKRKVIELRKQGKSYSEIKKIVNVSKSSLSLWLKDVLLSDKQIKGLKQKKIQSVERYKSSMKKLRLARLDKYLQNQFNKWIPLSEREKYIAGLFLYWGEGNKVSSSSVSIANTDPAVIKFGYYWMNKCLKISKEKIFVLLHLYSDMDVETEIEFWSNTLKINKRQFKKPYIKNSTRASVDQKGYGHGTCSIWAYNTEIKLNILMAIKTISDNYTRTKLLV